MGNSSSLGVGHRVLETAPYSPGAEAQLVAYLDVITAVNDQQLVSTSLLNQRQAQRLL